MLWYSLEAPRQDASNEYPQHMFSWRNKKDISIFWMKKVPYLLMGMASKKPYDLQSSRSACACTSGQFEQDLYNNKQNKTKQKKTCKAVLSSTGPACV